MNGVVQSNFLLAAAVLILQAAERDGFAQKRALAALAAALAALCWGKSTIGVLLVCALAAAFFVDGVRSTILSRRQKPLFFAPGDAGQAAEHGPAPQSTPKRGWNAWLAAAVLAGALAFVLLWALLYRHAINNLVFAPTLQKWSDTLLLLWRSCKPLLLLYAVSLIISLREFGRLGPTALAINAMVPGGIVAASLFYHYSFSESYFLLASVFAMWLCVGRVAARLFARPLASAAIALLCAASLASTLWYAAPTLRTGVQCALRCGGLRPSYALQAESITPADSAAAAWLRDNLAPGELFATNRNASSAAVPDGVFHYYTAAGQRQAYVEGWRYAMDYSLEYHTLRHNLEKVSDGIFAADSYHNAAALARENGIDCLLVWRPDGTAPWPEVSPDFAGGTVYIYRVPAGL